MKGDTRRVFEDLVVRALARGMSGASDRILVDGLVRSGRDVPERLLPGRMVMALPADEREALSRLGSDDAARYRPMRW